METLVFAVVRNVYIAKRFGFARLESGKEIFFHFNDRRMVVHELDKSLYIDEYLKDTQIPVRGDKIGLYIGVDGIGRTKARLWGFVEDPWTEEDVKEFHRANAQWLKDDEEFNYWTDHSY